uniref:hypothetical protein n=1 Tax=Rheinheimera sp. TaxID=1869214 RepID=UPI00404868FB
MLPKKTPLPDFRQMYTSAFGFWEKKHKIAADFFGISEQTAKRWYETNTPHPSAYRYLAVHNAGYLPLTHGWLHYRIGNDGLLHTPHGSCTAGDIAMLWRYKWTAEQSTKQLRATREKLKDITSGTKYKMLLHTADYLNRLVKEFTDGTG